MEFERMLHYLADLENNNNRTWFHENHKQYELAKHDFEQLLDTMRFSIAECAPDLAKDIVYGQPKDWMYRVPRDARLHKDLPPYNPSFRAYISPDRKSWKPIGYFFRLCPYGSLFGTGLFCRDSEELERTRRYISEHAWELLELAAKSGFSLTGESLKRVPKGFSPDDPAAEWIKMKNWNIMVDLPVEQYRSYEEFDAVIRDAVQRMEPLRQFLLQACALRQVNPNQRLKEFYQGW